MNWNNIDLDSNEELFHLIDGLTFEDLLTAINCNLPEITEETVRAQFEECLQRINRDAREVFESNLKNITAKALADRGN